MPKLIPGRKYEAEARPDGSLVLSEPAPPKPAKKPKPAKPVKPTISLAEAAARVAQRPPEPKPEPDPGYRIPDTVGPTAEARADERRADIEGKELVPWDTPPPRRALAVQQRRRWTWGCAGCGVKGLLQRRVVTVGQNDGRACAACSSIFDVQHRAGRYALGDDAVGDMEGRVVRRAAEVLGSEHEVVAFLADALAKSDAGLAHVQIGSRHLQFNARAEIRRSLLWAGQAHRPGVTMPDDPQPHWWVGERLVDVLPPLPPEPAPRPNPKRMKACPWCSEPSSDGSETLDTQVSVGAMHGRLCEPCAAKRSRSSDSGHALLSRIVESVPDTPAAKRAASMMAAAAADPSLWTRFEFEMAMDRMTWAGRCQQFRTKNGVSLEGLLDGIDPDNVGKAFDWHAAAER